MDKSTQNEYNRLLDKFSSKETTVTKNPNYIQQGFMCLVFFGMVLLVFFGFAELVEFLFLALGPIWYSALVVSISLFFGYLVMRRK